MSGPTEKDLADYLAALKADLANPHEGLPDPIFQFALKITPMINVDLLVRDDRGRTLLAWRDDAYGRGWHIPGGIVRWRETFAVRIAAVARLEIGADVSPDPDCCRISQLLTSGRGHFISLLYRCALLTPIPPDAFAPSEKEARAGQLLWSGGAPEAVYPAHEIYRDLLAGQSTVSS